MFAFCTLPVQSPEKNESRVNPKKFNSEFKKFANNNQYIELLTNPKVRYYLYYNVCESEDLILLLKLNVFNSLFYCHKSCFCYNNRCKSK